jgi:hypothetical protein
MNPFHDIFKNVIEYYDYQDTEPDSENNYVISIQDPDAFNAKVFQEVLYLKNYEFINILDEELFEFFKLDTVKGIIIQDFKNEDCILLNKESESDVYCIVNDALLKRRIFDYHLREKNVSMEYYNYCLVFIVLPILVLLLFSVALI